MALNEPARKGNPPVDAKPVPDPTPGAGISATRKRRYHFHWWHAVVGITGVVAVIAIGLGWKLLRVGTDVFGGTGNASPLEQLGRLIVPGDRELKQDAANRTNILIVGHGGPGHEGPYLADTIILASLDNTTQDVAMLSIPRDFLVDIPGYGYRKINNALAFGNTNDNPTGGDALMRDIVQDVTGQTVHYFARVDFNGFKQAVDAIGGIDVTVDTPFVDYEYPTYNYGYQTIRFDTGAQHFDGERALQFSRSRHGTNGEGSDFARSKRQQKLILALRDKALSLGTLTNPGKMSGLLDSLGAHVTTTFELWEVARLASIAEDLSSDKLISRVLETSPDNLVRQGTGTDGAYVIQPRLGLGNYAEIHELAANIFQNNAVLRESTPVQVVNATGETGLASAVSTYLRGFAYNITSYVQAPTGVRYEGTVIVDLSSGTATQTVAALQQKYGGTVSATLPIDVPLSAGTPLANTNASDGAPKVLLILGRSAVSIAKSSYPSAFQNLPPASST